MIFQSAFKYQASPARVIFGAGSLAELAEELKRDGHLSVLVLTTPAQAALGERIVDLIGTRAAGLFSEAAMHTPVEVTERALEQLNGVDCLVAIGGGSTIGLSKALSLRSGLPQIAIPTTFAGSEATAILGQTENGKKTTLNEPSVRPGTIIYDAELAASLPDDLVATSALNAMAHAVEGLYAKDRNPMSSVMAIEGVKALATAVPRIQTNRADLEAWSLAQYGAWLSGTVLGQVGMALHHKLCHVLGGSFGLAHAALHSVVLPHAIGYNEVAVAELLAPIADIFGTGTAAEGLFEFSRQIGAPNSLLQLGFQEADIPQAVDLALSRPYWNPRALTEEGLRGLLESATLGHFPDDKATEDKSDTSYFSEATSVAIVNSRNSGDVEPRTSEVFSALVGHLHAFVKDVALTQDEWELGIEFLTRTGQICSAERQEYILLSDVLGVSMLVDAINNRRPQSATPNTVFGPFHVDGAPVREMGDNVCLDGKGESCLFTGRVLDLNGNPIVGACVDVWSDNADGYYDVQQPNIQPKWNNRGRFFTDNDGAYAFIGIKPTSYPIPDDGTVGKLLGMLGRHPYRPAHMHFLVTAPGYQRLVTHTFVDGDQFLTSDAVFGVKSALVASFERSGRGDTIWRSAYDFVLVPRETPALVPRDDNDTADSVSAP